MRKTVKQSLIIVLIVIFNYSIIIIGCGNNNNGENQNNSLNNIANNINNSNNLNNNTQTVNNLNNKANQTENLNSNNINSNINNINNENDLNSNIQNTQNNNINSNIVNNIENNNNNEDNDFVIENAEQCLIPDDFTGEDSPVWLLENDYLTRTVCQTNKLNQIKAEGSNIHILPDESCNADLGCEMPDLETITIFGGSGIMKKITATVSRIETVKSDELNNFFTSIHFLDESENFEIGEFSLGNYRFTLDSHVPKDTLIGKSLIFIDLLIDIPVNEGFMINVPFILDSENDNLIFGSAAHDNYENIGHLYTELLPDFTYSGLYRYKKVDQICDESNFDNKINYISGSECESYEAGDLLVETDNGKYIIPVLSEGDVLIGDFTYGIVVNGVIKNSISTCNPENESSFTEYDFYIFDRNFFEPNPEYPRRYPQCYDSTE